MSFEKETHSFWLLFFLSVYLRTNVHMHTTQFIAIYYASSIKL